MLGLSFDYDACVRASEKVSWQLDDVMPPGTRLDFAKPFLPDALAGVRRLPFLSQAETRTLNQITGNAYLNLFAFVEEYILATVVKHALAETFGDQDAMRALLRFGDEEAKHMKLFARYLEAFEQGVGFETEVLGSAVAVAGVIMGKSPMAVLMVTLHLEIMTQAHYVECVRDDVEIDPFFAKLLRVHWLEEAQHARIDALELDKLLDHASPEQIHRAFLDYLELIAALDGLVASQAEMDARTLERAAGRQLSAPEQAELVASQHAGYRRTFLTYGMTNPMFVRHLETMSPQGAARVKARAAELASTAA
jgi:hypothetical protein